MSVNTNRFSFTRIRSNVTHFDQVIGAFKHFVMRDVKGGLYYYRTGSGEVDEVDFTVSTARPHRDYVGEHVRVRELSTGQPSITGVGLNPYRFFDARFDCVYYNYFDGTVWRPYQDDTCIADIIPSFAVGVGLDSGDVFLACQINTSVVLYKLDASMTKIFELNGVFLIDACEYGNDILLLLTKKDCDYPDEVLENDVFTGSFRFYLSSPFLCVCTASSDFQQIRSFSSDNRAALPLPCSPFVIRDTARVAFNNDRAYVAALVSDAVVADYIPAVAVCRDGYAWEYFDGGVKPFGNLRGVKFMDICVTSRDICFVSAEVENALYLKYYDRTSNRWKSYDRTEQLTFESATYTDVRSSSSSSVSSSSFSSSSESSCSSSSSISALASSSSSSMDFLTVLGAQDSVLETYWNLDEQSGTRVDIEGGYDLTPCGPVTSTEGMHGRAAHFSSPFLYLLDTAILRPFSGFAMSMWVKFDPASYAPYGYIAHKFNSYGVLCYSSPLEIEGYLRQSDGEKVEVRSDGSLTPLTVSNWYHVVFIAEGGTVTLYVNGELVDLSTYSGYLSSNGNPFRVGNPVHGFSGAVDELIWWKDPSFLSLQERDNFCKSLWRDGRGYTRRGSSWWSSSSSCSSSSSSSSSSCSCSSSSQSSSSSSSSSSSGV